MQGNGVVYYSCNTTTRRLGIKDVLRMVGGFWNWISRLNLNRGKIDPQKSVVGSNLGSGGSISGRPNRG